MMRYEFHVAGRISEVVRAAFPELNVAEGPTGGTILYGPVRDRAELRALLNRFDELAIAVIEMRRLPD